ncbi:tetratricopeptide repeat protein [Agarivorans gilvus]|uniref:DUF2971 domain-containing protein n=1 Tax=Agarivorans gilvus TaxID=680279 RepID=A0ABQ1I008_9ALTE|nr:DUF2971 domain-containing protein [Agarivorans gilvus]GGA95900.1 hypothetical protein GCM10007414_05940 [Agarivorans gilvus]
MDELQLKQHLRNKKYSKLEFLHDESEQHSNEKYLGYLYFLQDSRRDDTSSTLNKIIEKQSSLSQAYTYLGEIAASIYNTILDINIARIYFQEAISQDESNLRARWGLFTQTKQNDHFFAALSRSYSVDNFELINRYFIGWELNFNKLSPDNDWSLLFSVIDDERYKYKEHCKDLLALACYYEKQYEQGISLIKNTEIADPIVLKLYLNHGLISRELAASKLFSFQAISFLFDDHKAIYELYIKLKANSEDTYSKSTLMEIAFKAQEYAEVIKIFEGENVSLVQKGVKTHLIHQLAKMELGHKPSESTKFLAKHNLIINRDIDTECLHKALTINYYIWIMRTQTPNDNIESKWEYEIVQRLLNDYDLSEHYLYNRLNNLLSSLENDWEVNYRNTQINSLLKSIESHKATYNDITSYCAMEIQKKNYNEAIKALENYHDHNSPTIATTNLMGNALRCKGTLEEALSYYQNSLELMELHKEFYEHVIYNYLDTAQRLGINIEENRYKSLRNKFNEKLVESFSLKVHTTEKPSHLYKYYPLNINTLDALVNQYFYLPSKHQLNDPIEMPELEGIGETSLMDKNFRVCSFSNNSNSMLMWSHYTLNHEGMMVEYRFKGDLPKATGIEKVSYNPPQKRNMNRNKYIFNQFLLTKNHEWEYEKEVRLLSYKKDKLYFEDRNTVDFDDSKVNASIVAVTLGYKFPQSKFDLIKEIIHTLNSKRSPHQEKIKLKRAVLSEKNSFQLKYVPMC